MARKSGRVNFLTNLKSEFILTRHIFLPLFYSFFYIYQILQPWPSSTNSNHGAVAYFEYFWWYITAAAVELKTRMKKKMKYFFTAAAAVELSASISNIFPIFCQYFFKYFFSSSRIVDQCRCHQTLPTWPQNLIYFQTLSKFPLFPIFSELIMVFIIIP